jgi:hypothetical protein
MIKTYPTIGTFSILGGALWAMSTVLEKVRKQEELREMHKGDIAQQWLEPARYEKLLSQQQ